MTIPKRAHVLIGALPVISHFTPFQNVAQQLVKDGYDVSIISTPMFRDTIEGLGATFVPLPDVEDFTDERIAQEQARIIPLIVATGIPPEEAGLIVLLFVEMIPAQNAAIQEVLKKHRGTPVVMLNDPFFYGTLPLSLGAQGLKPQGVITVGTIPLSMHSIDTSPPFKGSVLDSSPEGRKRNAELNEKDIQGKGLQIAWYKRVMGECGIQNLAEPLPLNANYKLADIHLQLSPPSLEYPRSDEPKDLRYTGGLPRRDAVKSGTDLPTWWDDVVVNEENRQIVAVSQGTLVDDQNYLVIPTLEGLAQCDDILVVVALGKRGATLPAGTKIPANARVADWIPFDDLLGYTDVFVTNGGYGSFQNAIARGVPLVIAPLPFADKLDIAARVDWAGVGVNIGVGNTTPETVRKAVLSVCDDPKYKKRVLEIQEEIGGYDPMVVIERAIGDLAAKAGA